MRTLLLLDGNNAAHKARHTFSLAAPNGDDVSVVFGFLNSLRFGLKMFKPEACIIAWDGRIPRFRRMMVPSYKVKRKAKEDESYPIFLEQLRELQEILSLTGTVNVYRPSMEADDLLYHAAFLAKGKYDRIIIVTDDADLFQAVQIPNVFVYSSRKDTLIDQGYVKEEYGVEINQYVYWKALQGDVSDNIGGVPGIGPVRATKLFQKYKTLSIILEAAAKGEIKGKLGKNIREFGLEDISKNIYIMSLSEDRTGARKGLLEEVKEFAPLDVKRFKKRLFSRNFISIMDAGFFRDLGKLKAPDLKVDVRAPVICDWRFPVEA